MTETTKHLPGRTQETGHSIYHQPALRWQDGPDGYRVEAWWSEDDRAWIARTRGPDDAPALPSDPIGAGDTREDALLHLICATTLLCEVLASDRGEYPARNAPAPTPDGTRPRAE